MKNETNTNNSVINNKSDKPLSILQAAKEFGVSRVAINLACNEGRLSYTTTKTGKKRIYRKALEEYI